MIAKVHTATLHGIDAIEVTVEAGLSGGTPGFAIVGLPDASVRESGERVNAAIRSSGFDYPFKRVTVNLAPADLRKEGPALDLPIALSILSTSGQIPLDSFADTLIAGELGLDGLIRPVTGAVCMALMCQEKGYSRIILPEASAPEATVAQGVSVFGVKHLREVADLLIDPDSRDPLPTVDFENRPQPEYETDFGDVKGQSQAKRALEIAAAGGHNMMMVGAPGSGKTMLARRLPTILPPLTRQEAIEVTRIYSSAGMMDGRNGLIWERPFRSPHHGASHAAIVGGGRVPKPGQISLAHHGVLFLDEMPEFDRNVLEGLRQPLEDGVISVARVQASMDFPAQLMLVGAMNPCPCGFHGDRVKPCTCSPDGIRRYMGRISGPLLDRIDMHVQVPRLTQEELTSAKTGEASVQIRERVIGARKSQAKRLGGGNRVNARVTPKEMRTHCPLDDACREYLRVASGKLGLSARVYDRVIRVARTIADLEGIDEIREDHIGEAIQYRTLDRGQS
ncbi:MAG: YifB family Mg chelatase-like AAA ATPase [Armatimonadota bacterium]|nr:YifB family Mg chelatase-like AAA ATPase [Armatimonadota bacterium]